jgi:hypothetical protein
MTQISFLCNSKENFRRGASAMAVAAFLPGAGGALSVAAHAFRRHPGTDERCRTRGGRRDRRAGFAAMLVTGSVATFDGGVVRSTSSTTRDPKDVSVWAGKSPSFASAAAR